MKHFLLLIFVSICLSACSNTKPFVNAKGKVVKGVIVENLDGEGSMEHMIAMTVAECSNHFNNTMTNLEGEFEIKFEGTYSLVLLTGFYDGVYVELDANNFNRIVLDDKLLRQSRRLKKSVKKLLKNQTEN